MTVTWSTRTRERLSTAYALAAAFLVPWIVLLFFTQPYTGTARDLVAVSVGVPCAVVVGLLSTAWLHRRNPAVAPVTAAFTAGATFIMSWFHVLTGTGPSTKAAAIGALISIPVIALLGWIAFQDVDHSPRNASKTWIPAVLLLAAIGLVVAVIRLGSVTANEHRAHHLRLVWTGLDVFEFIGLAATAWALRKGSSRVAIAASATAALLLSDAWFNTVASTGSAQAEGLVLAGAEVPIAIVSLVIAWHATKRPTPASRKARR